MNQTNMIFVIWVIALMSEIVYSEETELTEILAELRSLKSRVSKLEKQCNNTSSIVDDVYYLMDQNIKINKKLDNLEKPSSDSESSMYYRDYQNLFWKFSGSFNSTYIFL